MIGSEHHTRRDIAVVGLWHLGEVYSAGLAELGHRVVGISGDETVVGNLLRNIPPLAEPGLAELLEKNQASGRLVYTTDFSQIKDCAVLWFTFDTPVDDQDEVDLLLIYQTLEVALPFLRDGVLVVMTSQTPVGTAVEIQEIIRQSRPELSFDYVYVPENLRLGEAMRCFFNPIRIVVGAESERAFGLVRELFAPLKTDFLEMSPASAEMSKHTLNAFLAVSLTFTYDVADICERVGADVIDVIRAVKSDERVGARAYLDANVGFSGGTLGRDVKALIKASLRQGIDIPVISGVWEKSKSRRLIVVRQLQRKLGSLEGKTVALFGLTYKAGTSTLRRSLSLEVAQDLGEAGARLRLCDPQADPAELKFEHSIFSRNPYMAACGAEAVVIMTPWPEFRTLDFARLKVAVLPPAVILDGRNFLVAREKEIIKAGFVYLSIGRGEKCRKTKQP